MNIHFNKIDRMFTDINFSHSNSKTNSLKNVLFRLMKGPCLYVQIIDGFLLRFSECVIISGYVIVVNVFRFMCYVFIVSVCSELLEMFWFYISETLRAGVADYEVFEVSLICCFFDLTPSLYTTCNFFSV